MLLLLLIEPEANPVYPIGATAEFVEEVTKASQEKGTRSKV